MPSQPVPVRMTTPTTVASATEAVVAREIQWSGGPGVSCPAAPLLTTALRNRGVSTVVDILGDAGDQVGVSGWAVFSGTTGFAVSAVDESRADDVRSVVSAWAAVCAPRRVLLAAPRSFCAGVERAIEVVERALDLAGPPVYVRKQVVHNVHVVRELEARGVVFVAELDEVPDRATVVFSAHGVSPAVRVEAAARRLDVIDATCPLVTKVHNEARRFAERGDTVVLVGHAGHEETEGTMGEAPGNVVLVENAADVAHLEVADPERVSYLTQTTLAVDETAEVLTALRRRFPAVRGPRSDDICYATTNRQNALRAVAADADVVVVIGSTNSSNSLRLVELSRRHGTAAHLVDDVMEIRPQWLAGASTIGLTAGASTPPRLVDEAVRVLGGLGPLTVEHREVTTETTEFSPPRKVRGR